MEAMSEPAVVIEFSPEIAALAKVLPKAQAAIAKVTKDAKNPHFDAKYASLYELADAILPAMNGAGITVLQPVASDDQGVRVMTMLLHESGQWLRSTHTIPVSKRDAQGYGSALTYARRQALQALLTVAAQGEDDDGEGAVGRGGGGGAKPPLKPPAQPERPTLAKRVAHLENTLRDVTTLRDLTRAWDLSKDLRAELAGTDAKEAARIDDIHEKRHVELLQGAG
jgi:hypothetical protein